MSETERQEPKLCPYRGVPWYPFGQYDVNVPRPAIPGEFGPCLQDKCAMWREYVIFRPIPGVMDCDGESVFGCGLAGKPQGHPLMGIGLIINQGDKQ